VHVPGTLFRGWLDMRVLREGALSGLKPTAAASSTCATTALRMVPEVRAGCYAAQQDIALTACLRPAALRQTGAVQLAAHSNGLTIRN
jgi:hypothetical protein